jgi:predicted nucleotidyltransferase
VKVNLYGSAASGLALRGTSDIDICVRIPEEAEELILNNNTLYEVVIEGLSLETQGGEVIKVGICLERPETLRHVELFKTYL